MEKTLISLSAPNVLTIGGILFLTLFVGAFAWQSLRAWLTPATPANNAAGW